MTPSSGITRVPPGLNERQRAIARLAVKGTPQKEIARELGLTRDQVKYTLKKIGLSLRGIREEAMPNSLADRWAVHLPAMKRQIREDVKRIMAET